MLSRSKSTKWLIIISTLITLYIVLSISLFTHDSFQHWLLTFSPNSAQNSLLVVVCLIGLSCFGLPRQVVAFTCGYFFEALFGGIFATVAVTIAAYLTFTFAQYFLQKHPFKKYQNQLDKITTFLSDSTFSKSIIIRLLPLGSNFLTNILAGIANIPKLPFLAGSFIGYIPQMFIFSLAGSGVKLAAKEHIMISVCLLILAMLLSWQLYRKIPSYRKLETIKKSD